jgi:multidrug efflux pump subunit AcrB
MGGSINTMILGGLALVFSRLIDNGVIVLENIFPAHGDGRISGRCRGARRNRGFDGRACRNLYDFHRVLPGHILQRHQQVHLHSVGAGRVFSIFASYFFAMTVVPLYCAKFIHLHHEGEDSKEPKRGILRPFREQL